MTLTHPRTPPIRRLFRLGLSGLVLCMPGGCGSPLPPPQVAVVNAEETPAPGRPVAAETAAQDKPVSEGAKSVSLVSGTSFLFPADSSGKLLGSLLTPAAPPRLPPPATQRQLARPIPIMVERPTLLPPPAVTVPPELPAPARPVLRPASIPEPVPLGSTGSPPETPGRIELPVTRLPARRGPDANRPAPLPVLARQTPDRASLEDPTPDFSAASVVGAKLPIRTEPAPFVKVNLPDPFENATVRLRDERREEIGGPAAPPSSPKVTLR